MKDFIKKNWKQIIIFLAIASVIIYLIFYFFNLFNILFSNSQTSECHEIYGNFGSYVGGIVGTIIGVITLILVYKTYTSQKNELKIQKELITQQQFESTFFNMLNVHRELKNNINLNSNVKICNIAKYIEKPDLEAKDDWFANKVKEEIKTFYEGIDTFSFIRLDFEVLFRMYKKLNTENGSKTFSSYIIKEKIKTDLINNRNLLISDEKEIIEKIFWLIFKNYRNILSHYFRNVYHILKFIRENENQISYQKYADIFQSQLNEDEQFLLFYNFIVFEDESKNEFSTISICNHYKFLENLGHENLLENEKHNSKNFYNFKVK